MSLLGNIIWFLAGGFIAFVGYMVAALLFMITIIGIPFGIQAFKLGGAMLAPFGKEITPLPDANSFLRIIFNLFWLFLVGWELAINHLVWGVILSITIIGLPFGMQHFKLIPLALFPFGQELRKVTAKEA
ncbi:YccF domain-containing protein [Myxococcota bacterium]|nr:YccF domain-containing protein [Myxococcota bacterium]